MKSRFSSVSYGNGLVAINRIFFYRTSIPRKHRRQIGISEFKISLKTAYLQKARASARLLAARVQHIFDALDGGHWKSMDQGLIQKLALKYLHETILYDEEYRASMGPRSLTSVQENEETLFHLITDQYEALATNEYGGVKSTAEEVIRQAEAEGLDVTELKHGKTSYNALCRELLKTRIELLGVVSYDGHPLAVQAIEKNRVILHDVSSSDKS